MAGAALGRVASRRLMAPLDDVATAAARIGAGGLQTRLPPTEDPDLATIVGSFNSMVEALDERIQRDARFAADLGHELRSPARRPSSPASQVIERRRDELPPRTQRALDLVSVELDRFQQTLEDLLELGRLDAGVRTQVLTQVDAAELVRISLEQSHRDPSMLRVTGTDRGPAGHFTVRVDKQQLGRALVNLYDNADRHAGGVRAVTVQRIRDRVRIDVDDRGDGVPRGRPRPDLRAVRPRRVPRVAPGQRPRPQHRRRDREQPGRPGLVRGRARWGRPVQHGAAHRAAPGSHRDPGRRPRRGVVT